MADQYLNKTVLTYFYNRLKTVFAEQGDIPVNVSDLTNDAGYITSADVPTKTSDLTNDSGFITSSALPTKLSDLTNDEGFIDNTVNNLVNYYTSANTYTKTEVDNIVAGITGVSFEIVQSLPQTGSIQ